MSARRYISSQIKDPRVIKAFVAIPRLKFVLKEYQPQAYEDYPLPIGEGQTISQPSLVAKMAEELQLKGKEKVLEIGTGSGFQTAILSRLAKKIYSIEIIESLAKKARGVLRQLGISNTKIFVGDGNQGIPEYAPYDGIIVSAAASRIPQELVDQLKENGRLVIPLKETAFGQMLKVGIKKNGKMVFEDIEPVTFVPLVDKF